jgi:hypothetical protein
MYELIMMYTCILLLLYTNELETAILLYYYYNNIYLLEAGASTTCKNDKGETPLRLEPDAAFCAAVLDRDHA